MRGWNLKETGKHPEWDACAFIEDRTDQRKDQLSVCFDDEKILEYPEETSVAIDDKENIKHKEQRLV